MKTPTPVHRTKEPPELRRIKCSAVRVVVERKRAQAGFLEMKASMAEVGQKVPIQVLDYGREDANGLRYDLIVGEGRLTAARELKWDTILALVVRAEGAEIAGRFLAENMIRRPFAWAENGRLVRDEIERGTPLPEVAKRFGISEGNAAKYLRVLRKSAHGLEDEVAMMPMNTAEVFITLPAKHQPIVIAQAKKSGVPILEVVEKARELTEQRGEGWTLPALDKAVRKSSADREAAIKRRKVVNLHHTLGPGNLRVLLRNPGVRKALAEEGISTEQFDAFSEA